MPLGMMIVALIGESRIFLVFKQNGAFYTRNVLFYAVMMYISTSWQAEITTGQKLEAFRSIIWMVFSAVFSIGFFLVVRFVVCKRVYPKEFLNLPSTIYHDILMRLVFPFLFMMRMAPEIIYTFFESYKSQSWYKLRYNWDIVFWASIVHILAIMSGAIMFKLRYTGLEKTEKNYPRNWMPIWETVKRIAKK